MKPERILFVDDDPALLSSTSRSLRKLYELETACGGQEALKILEQDKNFAVIVSDFQMPGMNGIEFLQKARKSLPEAVRSMLTGNADLSSAVEAVNKGQIFRFLSKPCDKETLCSCLDASIEQYRLRQGERTMMEQTFRGSIEVLADVLSLINPAAFGQAYRVRDYVRQMVTRLNLEDAWKYETAALLSQIGMVSIPADVLNHEEGDEERILECEQMLKRHPRVAKELLGKIPRLEGVAEMIAHQNLKHSEVASIDLDHHLALGSQILALALDFDREMSSGNCRGTVMRKLESRKGAYANRLLQILGEVKLPDQDTAPAYLPVKQIKVGMILDQDVRTHEGAMVATKGTQISSSTLARLCNYAELNTIDKKLRVRRDATHELDESERGAA